MKSFSLRIFYFSIIFFLLFDINFKFAPGLTTSRVVFFLLAFLSFYYWFRFEFKISRYFLNYFSWYFLLLGVIVSISFLQYMYSNDPTQLGRFTYFTMYGVLTPLMLNNFNLSKKLFLLFVGLAVLLQAFLTLGSYFFPNIKELFDLLILYNANFGSENNLRALGFVSVAGATFSVIQFTGVVSFLILLSQNYLFIYQKILIWISILIILISILFIGRTGLFLSLLSIFMYIIFKKNSFNIIFYILISSFILLNIDFISLLENVTSNIDGYDIEYFIAWINSGFRLNNDLVQGLNDMPIPPLSINTVLGTGLVMGPNGVGNASGHDSGYIQSYYSLGLIVSILFYLSYYLFLFIQAKRHKDIIGFLLILVIVLIEFKEFFIFSYTYPFYLFSYLLLGEDKYFEKK